MNLKFLKIAILISSLLGVSLHASVHQNLLDLIGTQPAKEQFKLWHYIMNKPYDLNTNLAVAKYKVFKSNLQFIKETNEKNLSYQVGLGPYTDLSFEEFKEFSSNQAYKETANNFKKAEGNTEYASKDWTYLFGAPKNQGSCGSCWAFATVGVIEAFAKLELNKEIKLSEQQLIDCGSGPTFGKLNGCEGGKYQDSFYYIHRFGIMLDEDYPYTAVEETCKYKESNKRITMNSDKSCHINGFYNVCNEEFIISLISKGPYATNINFDKAFQHYINGYYYASECGATTNHSVIVVEYNKIHDYFKIRNSYGFFWGQYGYAKVKVSESNGDFKGCGLKEYGYQPDGVKLIN